MIIGDRNCVGSIKWHNSVERDHDEYVDSDLPYASLDLTSPFEGGSRVIQISVGRIPSSAKNGFAEAISYLNNAMSYDSRGVELDAFAFSKKKSEKCSEMIFSRIHPDFFVSPPFTFLDVDDKGSSPYTLLSPRNTYNLLCLNMHGSSKNDNLSNDDGYKEVYSPQCLPKGNDVKYVMCATTCYGAKPVIRHGNNQSILVTALTNGCLGFVGSTQVVWGRWDRAIEEGFSPYAGYVVVGEFANGVGSGLSLGESYMDAISKTAVYEQDSNTPDHCGIKAIASFALYGDPSLHLIGRNEFSKSSSYDVSQKSFHIPISSVKKTTNTKLTAVKNEIEEIVSEILSEIYGDLTGVTIDYYRESGYDGYKIIANKSVEYGTSAAIIYIDKNEKVENVLVSN